MGWEDRPYYRDRSSRPTNPLAWAMNGSVPLFTIFGIRVRAHASLLITIAVVLLLGIGPGATWQDSVQSMAMLFIVVLLHEFGHCFAARWMGGHAEDILMTPLGGLAYTSAPRRPWPTFVTVLGGPAVNVLICLICTGILWAVRGWASWNLIGFMRVAHAYSLFSFISIVVWMYQISWMLLLFNLLPIFPLDGGQMLQAILWPKFGYYRSMLFACNTGMIGAALLGAVAIATWSILLLLVMISGFVTCLMMKRQLLAAGPYGFVDEPNYSSSLSDHPHHRKLSRRSIKRAQKLERDDRIEQQKIDQILAKVSAHGMHSLTWWERRTLRKATARQRQVEAMHSRR